MKLHVTLMALAALVSLGVGGCASTEDRTASATAQDQDAQSRIDRQNIEESRRLQPESMKQGAETPLYKENQPIGGQKQAGPADFPQPAFPWVKGELVQIEGEYYVLKDAEGKEVRVHVDKGTAMSGSLHVGDIIEAHRNLQGHALSLAKSSTPLTTGQSSGSAGMGADSRDRIVSDRTITLSGARQAVRGLVLKMDGDQYLIKDGQGNEIRLPFNQNTRMFCGTKKGSLESLMPAPSASDKPGSTGQSQDLAQTAEQQGSQVGPGTRSGEPAAGSECHFSKGDMIEAEMSDMGVATFIKQAGRPQPGDPLP